MRAATKPNNPYDDTVVTADPGFISIKNTGLPDNANVRAVLIDDADSSWASGGYERTYPLDMISAGNGEFYTPFPAIGIVSGGSASPTLTHHWQLAIVEIRANPDGSDRWLVDPQ